MQYIRRNWFDVGTMVWAISLLIVGILWVATPAFATADVGVDCGMVCSVGCDNSLPATHWFRSCTTRSPRPSLTHSVHGFVGVVTL